MTLTEWNSMFGLEATQLEPVRSPVQLQTALSPVPTVRSIAESSVQVAQLLQGVSEGERNVACTQLAGHFIGKGITLDVVEHLLCDFAKKCSPPLPDAEVHTVIESIARAERRKAPEDIGEDSSAFLARVCRNHRQPMLIENLIPAEGITLFHGQPRSAKSLVGLYLGLVVAAGVPAFGSDQYSVSSPRPVLYINEEDPESVVSERLRGFCRGLSLADPPRTLRLSISRALSVDQPADQDAIIATIKRHGCGLVIFDPLRRVTKHADQGPAELAPVIDFWHRVTRETNAVVWIVHHDTKPLPNAHEHRDLSHRASGGAIFSSCHSLIHFHRLEVESAVGFDVTPGAYKFMATPAPFTVRLLISDASWRLSWEERRTLVANDEVKNRAKILDFIRQNPDSSITAVATAVGGKRTTTLALIRRMAGEKAITQRQKGKAMLCRVADNTPVSD